MRFPGLAILLLTFSFSAWGQIIGHRSVDEVTSLSRSVADAIGNQKWFFTHASLGMNSVLYRGMSGLHRSDRARYRLSQVRVEPAFGPAPSPPPSQAVVGTIYHWPRGQTDNAVRSGRWRSPAVDIVMDKLCFIDFAASATAYLDAMAALERDFPETIFVYVTMPLLRTDRADRPEWRDHCALTNRYNKAVRDYCTRNRRVLFDLADIEAHDPDGREQTFAHSGQTYQTLYLGYAQGSSNYLNNLGSRRLALGWYATAAVIASRPSAGGRSDRAR